MVKADGSKGGLGPGGRQMARNRESIKSESKSVLSRHEFHMRRAIALARSQPRLPFGSVIVHKDSIIGEGQNRTHQNPILHGEIDAINQVAAKFPRLNWSAVSLYTTAEPCPMCQAAVAWAGIGSVIYGASIPQLKRLGWWQIDLRATEIARRSPAPPCRILGGILEKECLELFESVRQ